MNGRGGQEEEVIEKGTEKERKGRGKKKKKGEQVKKCNSTGRIKIKVNGKKWREGKEGRKVEKK